MKAGLKPEKLLVYAGLANDFEHSPVEIITPSELQSISTLKNPNGMLGVFKMPQPSQIEDSDWIVVLDDIRDPGNLGTIVRLCDWFGVHNLVCSTSTVDVYNPKVLQATMGSLARVNMVYADLVDFLKNANRPIFGAYMDGTTVYAEKLPKTGILVLGNESNGISPEIRQYTKHKITIPQFGGTTAESLNVAMATGILLNEIRRGRLLQN